MAATKSTAKKSATTKAAKKPAKRSRTLSAEERAALRETMKESDVATADHGAVLEKIAEMPKEDRELAERLHEIITKAAPELTSRTWYGMPAYVQDGKIVCFFQGAYKFKARYATLGFTDSADLDEGSMWPTAFALTKLTGAAETQVRKLVKQAVR